MKPCPHMKTLLSALADGSLTGLAHWYAAHHAQRCPGCSQALSDLHTVRERIRALGMPQSEVLRLSEERWKGLEAAWNHMDEQNP